MTVSDLLEQPCNKSGNINKVVTSCSQLVPNLLTTWDKQCEHNLLTDLLQDEIFTCVVEYTRKNLTSCNKFVNKSSSHCLSQVVNKFGTSC